MMFLRYIAPKSKANRKNVSVDMVVSDVAYKERLNMPIIAEQVAREQPEHLWDYFMDRVRYYREQNIQLPRASDSRYIEMSEQNAKNRREKIVISSCNQMLLSVYKCHFLIKN